MEAGRHFAVAVVNINTLTPPFPPPSLSRALPPSNPPLIPSKAVVAVHPDPVVAISTPHARSSASAAFLPVRRGSTPTADRVDRTSPARRAAERDRPRHLARRFESPALQHCRPPIACRAPPVLRPAARISDGWAAYETTPPSQRNIAQPEGGHGTRGELSESPPWTPSGRPTLGGPSASTQHQVHHENPARVCEPPTKRVKSCTRPRRWGLLAPRADWEPSARWVLRGRGRDATDVPSGPSPPRIAERRAGGADTRGIEPACG